MIRYFVCALISNTATIAMLAVGASTTDGRTACSPEGVPTGGSGHTCKW